MRAIAAFSVAFVVSYPLFTVNNLAFLWYYPNDARWSIGKVAGLRNGMQWYGWVLDALIFALVIGALAWAVPLRSSRSAWPALASIVPIAMLIFSVYVVYVNWWLR